MNKSAPDGSKVTHGQVLKSLHGFGDVLDVKTTRYKWLKHDGEEADFPIFTQFLELDFVMPVTLSCPVYGGNAGHWPLNPLTGKGF